MCMKTEQQIFKETILSWLKENNIDLSNKKVRVFNSRRYGLEVRVYGVSMEVSNNRKSRRMLKTPNEDYNCTYGIHSRKISMYTAIGKKEFENKKEREFILDTIRWN